MTAVGLRLELERAGMGDEDTLGVAFMSEIPWRGRRYARAEERAAEAERMAAQTDAEAVRHRIRTAVTRAERAERLAATARRLSLETLERFNAEYETLVRSAGVSGAGESTVFSRRRTPGKGHRDRTPGDPGRHRRAHRAGGTLALRLTGTLFSRSTLIHHDPQPDPFRRHLRRRRAHRPRRARRLVQSA
jgi:hypothetical protein